MAPNQQFSMNDGVLLASLIYSAYDLTSEWELFGTCRRPIHWWLLGSYVCVVSFRCVHVAGSYLVEDGGGDEFLLNLRQKTNKSKSLLAFTWLVCLPLFIFSTIVGSFWLYQVVQHSPTCVPTEFHLWFAGFWLLLCYGSIFVYAALAIAAWILERRIRSAERDLAEVVGGSDAMSRWGNVGTIASFQSLSAPDAGLTPAQIKALPGEGVVGGSCDGQHASDMLCEDQLAGEHGCVVRCCGEDCSICLNTLEHGENIRRLPSCDHTFHRSCIDLWLLRRADCPLCKRDVRKALDITDGVHYV